MGLFKPLTQLTSIADYFSPGTSHIVAADHSGLAISAITTVNTLFGSKVMVPETGVVMNNEMDGTERASSFYAEQ